MRNIHTLPLLRGDRRSRIVNQITVILMHLLIVALAAIRRLTPVALVVLLNALAAWRLIRACPSPRPEAAPVGFVGWPLWFHRFNLIHNQRFGWLYILDLAVGVIWTMVLA